ncbi:MAG: hypothetical protein M3R62_05710 [Acidobacteriota bacterium]|nr:hypothetical protein [Acidobacteriota bacterium]
MSRAIAMFGGTERALAALMSLVLAAACSERSPTAPETVLGTSAASADASAAARVRRPPTRVIEPRGNGAPLLAAVWGGEKAELTVTGAGATVRLFCAHGTVDRPILFDTSGHFDVPGTLVREGGPVPIDDTPFRRPARYTGWTDGQMMILTVEVEGSSLGPFTLVAGQKSKLGGCPIL